MVVYHGTIITLDKENNIYKYLVENFGKIIYVGDILPKFYQYSETVELGDRVLIPTFCDSHQHFASFSLFNSGLNVMEANSNIEIKEMIKEFLTRCEDNLIILFGASPYSVKEKKLICRKELDEVCPNKPLVVIKYDGHACIVNSKLLKKIKRRVKDLRGYHPDTGEMNQEAFFTVSNYISSSVSIKKLIKNMEQAVEYEIKNGIGMVHTVSGIGFPFNIDITIENWFSKHLKYGFQLRVFPQSLDIKVAQRRHLTRIGGCFKCALDGCFGSQDAALNEPNTNGDSGVLYYTDEQVIDFCKKANRAGLQIEMHAIGDRAFDQATRALKAALDDFPREDHRHGIIHCCLPTKEGIEICKKYKIQMPVQSSFINWRQEPNEYLEALLSKKRVNNLNPLKTLVRNDIILSFGSDGPCTDPNPIEWLYKACNNGKESLTIEEALKCATYNGYWVTFDEQERGSLKVGKIADMVILNKNPYSLDIADLRELKVEKTILKGIEQ